MLVWEFTSFSSVFFSTNRFYIDFLLFWSLHSHCWCCCFLQSSIQVREDLMSRFSRKPSSVATGNTMLSARQNSISDRVYTERFFVLQSLCIRLWVRFDPQEKYAPNPKDSQIKSRPHPIKLVIGVKIEKSII